MSHKYETGIYHIKYFDRYGSAVPGMPEEALTARSMLNAVDVGQRCAGADESFVIQRVVYNSLDHRAVSGDEE